jgi:hypothetical protein
MMVLSLSSMVLWDGGGQLWLTWSLRYALCASPASYPSIVVAVAARAYNGGSRGKKAGAAASHMRGQVRHTQRWSRLRAE